MRQPAIALILAGSLVMPGACADAEPPLGPPPSPLFDHFTNEAEDGDYSVYFLDMEPARDLKIRVAQDASEPGVLVECDPVSEPTGFSPAWGDGLFRVIGTGGIRGGSLTVDEACYYDGWHPDGFPESVVARGTAHHAGVDYDFVVNLKSTHFPSDLSSLDRAFLTVVGLGIENLEFRGQLHHEDRAF